jgi:hypothetical protein
MLCESMHACCSSESGCTFVNSLNTFRRFTRENGESSRQMATDGKHWYATEAWLNAYARRRGHGSDEGARAEGGGKALADPDEASVDLTKGARGGAPRFISAPAAKRNAASLARTASAPRFE